MVVDERFGSLLGGSQGDAMDDSGGQGSGGIELSGGGCGGGQMVGSVPVSLSCNARRMQRRRAASRVGGGGASVSPG